MVHGLLWWNIGRNGNATQHCFSDINDYLLCPLGIISLHTIRMCGSDRNGYSDPDGTDQRRSRPQ